MVRFEFPSSNGDGSLTEATISSSLVVSHCSTCGSWSSYHVTANHIDVIVRSYSQHIMHQSLPRSTAAFCQCSVCEFTYGCPNSTSYVK